MKIARFFIIAVHAATASAGLLLVEKSKLDEGCDMGKSEEHTRGLALFEEDYNLSRRGTKSSKKTDGSKGCTTVPAEARDFVWGTCVDVTLQRIGIECGFVKVPLDYNKPRGRTIELAVSRGVHTDHKDYRGIMLVMTPTGRPGARGLLFAAAKFFIDPAIATKYDLIGWDPRGAGESIPSLSCRTDDGGFPSKQSNRSQWRRKDNVHERECHDKHHHLLPHMITPTNNARDVDYIRESLGADITNFYGFSYDTPTEQVYATMFPDKVGEFLLDGVVPYRHKHKNLDQTTMIDDKYFDWLVQNYEIESIAKSLFAWIAQFHSVYGLGSVPLEVREAYLVARQEFFENPMPQVGPAEWDAIFYRLSSQHDTWITAAQLLSDWINLKNETRLVESLSSHVLLSRAFATRLSVTSGDALTHYSRNSVFSG